MSDETLIRDLVRAGLDAELVGRVANAIAAGIVRDNVRDMVRAYEADRKRRQRKSVDKLSGKQTMSAQSSALENDKNVPDNSSEHCDLSFFSSSDSQRSKEEKSSRKGTRLRPGVTIGEADRMFALDRLTAEQTQQAWAEFVDYWIGIPGARGCKLDWSATWRNRVRQIAGRKGNGSGKRNGVMEALDIAIDRAGGGEVQGDFEIRDITPRSR